MRHFAVLVGLVSFLTTQACAPSPAWEALPGSFQLTADVAVDSTGTIYFTDARTNRILKIGPDGVPTVWKEHTGGSHGIAAGPDGRLYAGQHNEKRIVAYAPDGSETVVVPDVQTHHLVVTASNNIYFADAPNHKIWLVDQAGQKRVATTEVDWPHGMKISADQSSFFVTDLNKGSVWAFRIEADGSLARRTSLCFLKTPGEAGGVTLDRDGTVHVATQPGVQVCDASGKVTEIIPPPGKEPVNNLFFAGRNLEWLYVTDGEHFFRRRQ
jgi:gluconolactonase